MDSKEFVARVAMEKEHLLGAYLDPDAGSDVGKRIESLSLTPEQRKELKTILDNVLTDAFYTMLLGLDGAASLGGDQRLYELRDEDGTVLTGDLEGFAWEHFHSSRNE